MADLKARIGNKIPEDNSPERRRYRNLVWKNPIVADTSPKQKSAHPIHTHTPYTTLKHNNASGSALQVHPNSTVLQMKLISSTSPSSLLDRMDISANTLADALDVNGDNFSNRPTSLIDRLGEKNGEVATQPGSSVISTAASDSGLEAIVNREEVSSREFECAATIKPCHSFSNNTFGMSNALPLFAHNPDQSGITQQIDYPPQMQHSKFSPPQQMTPPASTSKLVLDTLLPSVSDIAMNSHQGADMFPLPNSGVRTDSSRSPAPQTQSTESARDADGSSGPTRISASLCRKMLLPVVLKNAKLRPGFSKMQPEMVENSLSDLLTDDICQSFMATIDSVKKDLEAADIKRDESNKTLPENTLEQNPSDLNGVPSSFLPSPPISESDSMPPIAPRAMLASRWDQEGSTRSDTIVQQSPWKGKGKADDPKGNGFDIGRRFSTDSVQTHRHDPQSPRSRSSTNNGRVLLAESTQGHLISSRTPEQQYKEPSTLGISIPMDPQFFAQPRDNEPKKSTRVPTPERLTHYHLHLPRPTVSPSHYRKPSGQTDFRGTRGRGSITPERYARRGRRSPSPPHNSISSTHRHRPSSPRPDDFKRKRHAKSPPPRHYHSRHHTHHSISSSPSRLSASPARHRLPSPRRKPSPSPPPRRKRHRLSRTPNRSISPFENRKPRSLYPNERRHHDLDSREPYSRPHDSTRSRKSSNQYPYSDIRTPRTSAPSVFDELANEERKPDLSKLNTRPPVPTVVYPCHNVPGLWFAKAGLASADILECSFVVDRETAIKWNLNEETPVSSTPGPKFVRKKKSELSLKLLCLPVHAVKSMQESLDLRTATPAAIANGMSEIKIEWPSQGTLIIEVNPMHKWGKTWLPHYLGESSQGVDITNHIQEGTNVVRFIQLSGMMNSMFVLHAAPTQSQHSSNSNTTSIDLNFNKLDSYLASLAERANPEPNSGMLRIQAATIRVT